MTYQCAKAVGIPVIGCGGISTAEDVLEYMFAGATAVQIGTATFVRPDAMLTAIDGLERYCTDHSLDARQLIGALRDEELRVDEQEAVL
jgi:dihydroorotate dehydrogenase (NAD+) catalytic subunit